MANLSPQSRDVLIQHAPFATVEWDQHLRIITWSPKAEALFGWSSSAITGPLQDSLLFDHDTAQFESDITNLFLKHCQTVTSRVRNRTKDGRWIDCEWIHSPVYQADRVTSVLSTVIDVSARRIFQTKNEHILQHMSDGFVSVDRNLRITDANHRFEQYHGKKATLIGKSFFEVLPDTVGTINETELDAALTYNQVRIYETYSPTFDQWYEVRAIPTPDGLSIFYNEITERKRKEHQLAESEMKFRRLSESNILGIMRFTADGDVLEANDAVLQMLGYSRDEFLNTHLNLVQITPPEWQPVDVAEMRTLNDHGYMKPYEKEFFRRDGTRIPVLIGAANFHKNSNQFMAYVLDLSLRKQSESRLHLSAEAAGITFWDWDIATDEVEWTNPWIFLDRSQIKSLTHKYKVTPSQFFERIHPDDRDAVLKSTEKALKEKKVLRHEFRVYTPDGKLHWVQGYAQLFIDKDGKPYRMIGTNIDITEVKNAVTELNESRTHLDVALSVARMGVWEIDFQHKNIKRVETHYHLFGFSEPPKEWNFDVFLTTLHPEDREMVRRRMSEAAQGHFSDQSAEFRVIWPDGSVHWLYTRARLMHHAQTGLPERLVGAVIDVTTMKEAQLKLEKAVTVRDEFLSVASHELRTPITSLNLQTQILQRLLNTSPENLSCERINRHLDAIQSQVKKLASLVDDLLDVTRIANGKLTLLPERVDLAQLVRQTYQSMQEQFINAKCEVEIITQGEAVGMWDRRKVEQVVVNLLTNACKYGRGRPVRVYVLRTQNTARLVVKDHGIGISQEYQTRIFERFERAVKGSAFSGLGLGLFISKQIVKAHAGEINVYSQEGHGATFTVDLPLASKKIAPPKAAHNRVGA